MGTRGVLAALMCVAYVAAQTTENPQLTGYRSGVPMQLRVLEMRKVLREGFPLGRDHNLRVLLADHESLPSISSWSLTTITTNKQNTTSITALSVDQTVLEFEASLDGAYSAIVTARNSSDFSIAVAFTQLNTTDMDSQLAWVGGGYDKSKSSLRVWPGSVEEMWIGKQVCRSKDAPCYYVAETLPEHIPRCIDVTQGTGDTMMQCDDIITQFQEAESQPHMTVSGGNLTIQIQFHTSPAKIEAVVFDTKDPSRILSPVGFQCQVVATPRSAAHCRQTLTDTEDLERLMVIVVALDHDGFVFESRMDLYDGTHHEDDIRLIIGCVVGGICGLAIITAIVVYLIKDKKEANKKGVGKKESESGRSSSGYQQTATSEPVPVHQQEV